MDDLRASGLWSETESLEPFNCLEFKAVWLGLLSFLSTVEDSTVLAISDNTTVVGYIRNKGDIKSDQFNQLSSRLLRWSEPVGSAHSRESQHAGLRPVHESSSSVQLVSQPLGLPMSLETVGQPHLDPFATSEDTRLPFYVSPFPDPQVWAVDALAFEWSSLWAYAFPPFLLLPVVLRKVREGSSEVILVARTEPRSPGFQISWSCWSTFPGSFRCHETC